MSQDLIRIHSSLAVRGIALRPWPRCTDHQMFQWRNFDGLLQINEVAIVIIAIMTDRPGSGKLSDLMDAFEAATDECDMAVFVVHFWNERLQKWFGRRGYLIDSNQQMGRYAARATVATTS